LTLRAVGARGEAEFELIRAIADSSGEDAELRASFLLGVMRLEEMEFEKAWRIFDGALPKLGWDEGEISELRRLFEEGRKASSHRSERVAQLLSTLLPGSGQIYAGDWKGGLNAALLNGVLWWWALREWREGSRLESIGILTMLIPRYYIGNILNARRAAREANVRLGRNIALRIFERIRRGISSARLKVKRRSRLLGFALRRREQDVVQDQSISR